mmetsp:Transcript_11878/g.35401  ORF Transcript_11878/g.35401 Transcript_11878/m.35401 type:complete len:255 (-) Transcript_11878:30-794(-)
MTISFMPPGVCSATSSASVCGPASSASEVMVAKTPPTYAAAAAASTPWPTSHSCAASWRLYRSPMRHVIVCRRLNCASVGTGTALPSASKMATAAPSAGATIVVPRRAATAGSGHASATFSEPVQRRTSSSATPAMRDMTRCAAPNRRGSSTARAWPGSTARMTQSLPSTTAWLSRAMWQRPGKASASAAPLAAPRGESTKVLVTPSAPQRPRTQALEMVPTPTTPMRSGTMALAEAATAITRGERRIHRRSAP